MKQQIHTLKLVQRVWESVVQPGDFCIDATAGRGHDTVKLAQLVGEKGRVLAFDIQSQALESTKALLTEQGLSERVQLILDSHGHMTHYGETESIAVIAFNLGYLPGGDHLVATKASETIAAIGQGLTLLRQRGVMTICIYHGHDSGFAERDAVLAYLQTLDYHLYTVLLTDFYNRPNYPPLAAIIYKGI